MSTAVYVDTVFVTLFPTTVETVSSLTVYKLLCKGDFATTLLSIHRHWLERVPN